MLLFLQYGDDGTDQSFIIDISWGAEYPNELPKITLDTFYNQNM